MLTLLQMNMEPQNHWVVEENGLPQVNSQLVNLRGSRHMLEIGIAELRHPLHWLGQPAVCKHLT